MRGVARALGGGAVQRLLAVQRELQEGADSSRRRRALGREARCVGHIRKLDRMHQRLPAYTTHTYVRTSVYRAAADPSASQTRSLFEGARRGRRRPRPVAGGGAPGKCERSTAGGSAWRRMHRRPAAPARRHSAPPLARGARTCRPRAARAPPRPCRSSRARSGTARPRRRRGPQAPISTTRRRSARLCAEPKPKTEADAAAPCVSAEPAAARRS